MEKKRSELTEEIETTTKRIKLDIDTEIKNEVEEISDGDVEMEDPFPEWTVRANDVMNISFVRSEEDMKDKTKQFHPSFTHQNFNKEKIVGFKGLQLNLYFSPAFDVLVENIFTEKSEKQPIADDVLRILSTRLTQGQPVNDRTTFMKLLDDQNYNFKPFGNLIHSYQTSKPNTTYEIYKCELTDPNVKQFHVKVQPFVLWFIDGASYITSIGDNEDDSSWNIFYIFEKQQESEKSKYSLVGFTTIYNFYAYPDLMRKRISQVLILPTYQRQGHGVHLLRSIYNDCHSNPKIKDITVEDASLDFTRLRDCVDIKILLEEVDFFKEDPLPSLDSTIVEQIRKETKFSTEQIKHCYDIIDFKQTDQQDKEQYKEFRMRIKRKLYKKYEDILSDKSDPKEKKQELDAIYKELEQGFKDVLSKVEKLD